MSFVHNDPDFMQLLAIVARKTGITAPLVEKDYWVTHCLWALHQTDLAVWFKGGTSLSKGFHIIERFSEDLDLMIRRGSVEGLPPVTNWTSENKGPVKKRRAFYRALPDAFAIPDVDVTLDTTHMDRRARSADYLGRYPGLLAGHLPATMSSFVRFEVGRARVVPYVEMPLTSFVHDYLESEGMLGDYKDNRPKAVRCVHPLVTLLEKFDAMARRYARDVLEPDSFVRHYEDAAQIIRAVDRLPSIEMTAKALAENMLAQKDIAALPNETAPSLVLSEPTKRALVEQAYNEIAPMFWGKRIPLDEARQIILDWASALQDSGRRQSPA
jgi:hypothetical protein